MSRNLRHTQNPPVLAQKSIKRPIASDNSSDDDYAGVDLISDTEEDEPDVEVAEEQAIIESEEDDIDDAVLQPENDDDQSSWAGFELDEPPFDGGDPFFSDHITRTSTPNMYAEATAWEINSSRRVRFDLSDSDSSDTEVNIFPDIFLDQNSLDPQFRQTIENDHDNDNDDPPSDEGSYWDFRGDETDMIQNVNDDEEKDSDGSTGSSGYETDEGETTEEDLPPAAQYVPTRSVLRRQSTDSSDSAEEITVVRRNPYRRNGPRLGSWVTDASKPYAVLDSRGKYLYMFRARTDRRYSFDTSPSQPVHHLLDGRRNDLLHEPFPMMRNRADMMLSAMFTPMDSLFRGNALGPPEAFYPFVSVTANGVITQDDPTSSFDDDDIDDDDVWNIGDLIDFGEEASDEDCPDEEGDSSTSPGDTPSTPLRPTTASSEDQVHPLFNHLDRGVVGAFRRNQSRHQLLTRSAASRDSLAFSGPYGEGTLRGIKGGRLAAVNTPITPLRKSKAPVPSFSAASSTMDTEAIRQERQKRKFSGEQQHGHKRSRSLF